LNENIICRSGHPKRHKYIAKTQRNEGIAGFGAKNIWRMGANAKK
jgi:hypothetical protein